MKALDKKLWRELWGMRMQVLAIAMVIISGVVIFIMLLSTLDSLYETRESYYRDHHFAHIFASLKRAPLSLVKRIEEIPGVDKVETRVVAYVNLDVTGFDDPVSGHILSLPDNSRGLLNQIYLRNGHLIEPGRDNEIVLSEEFARAHKLQPGDKLGATINGRRKMLTIVGLALSPEYIHQIAPGAMFPDHARYGVLWIARQLLATAYDMEGAFNNVTLTLSGDTNEQTVIDCLDDILKDYGGIGTIARKDQLSNRFLSEELKQQRTIATIFPVIFFGVAAFLLNVVISRLIRLQREEIATLKAFGYSDIAVGLHFIKLVLLIVSLGVFIGIGAGIWMGKGMSNIYMVMYSLPYMIYVLKPEVVIAAARLAVIEHKRLLTLVEKGVISSDAYDKAATKVQTSAAVQRSADFQIEVAKYELQAARTVLEYTAASTGEPAERLPVVSPITGRVLKVVSECEGPVRTGDMLLEVGDPTVLEVEVDVLSADAVKIKPGMKVLFDRWGGEQPLEGIVRIIEPVGFTKISALGVEEQRVLIISDFTSPAEQWQRLGDGYRVEARFILWHQDDVLQVPASSLFRYQQGWAVFVVENNHAKRRLVRVGQRNGLVAQILEGVSEGEAVVNHPSDDVEDGVRVKQRF